MNTNDEREDWIRELTETRDQLGRLAIQLRDMKNEKFYGMIGRIEHLNIRLNAIKYWLESLS